MHLTAGGSQMSSRPTVHMDFNRPGFLIPIRTDCLGFLSTRFSYGHGQEDGGGLQALQLVPGRRKKQRPGWLDAPCSRNRSPPGKWPGELLDAPMPAQPSVVAAARPSSVPYSQWGQAVHSRRRSRGSPMPSLRTPSREDSVVEATGRCQPRRRSLGRACEPQRVAGPEAAGRMDDLPPLR
jgi:hypothetical protein